MDWVKVLSTLKETLRYTLSPIFPSLSSFLSLLQGIKYSILVLAKRLGEKFLKISEYFPYLAGYKRQSYLPHLMQWKTGEV